MKRAMTASMMLVVCKAAPVPVTVFSEYRENMYSDKVERFNTTITAETFTDFVGKLRLEATAQWGQMGKSCYFTNYMWAPGGEGYDGLVGGLERWGITGYPEEDPALPPWGISELHKALGFDAGNSHPCPFFTDIP